MVTLIDTLCSMERYEGFGEVRDNGPLDNKLEVEQLNRFLRRLYDNRGEADLTDNIIIASPYAPQVNRPHDRLTHGQGFCARHPELRVLIDTTDALQGSERSVAVISLTRSNRRTHVGFLREDRRLNVAFSRACNVICVIGDFSTMDFCPIASHVYHSAVEGYPRTSLQFHRPPRQREDPVQMNEMQRIKNGMEHQSH